MSKKLEAIEIYQKLLKLAKGQDFNEFNTAVNFARNKLEQDHWAKQQSLNPYGGQLGMAAACAVPAIELGAVKTKATRQKKTR